MLCIVSSGDTLIFYFVIDTNICFPCEVIDKRIWKKVVEQIASCAFLLIQLDS